MGVIDEDWRTVALADQFKPPFGAFEMRERLEHRFRFAAGSDGKSGRHQRVLDLEFADQRQAQQVLPSGVFQREPLRKAFDRRIDEANAGMHAIATAADAHHRKIARRRGLDHRGRAIMIGGDHRDAIGIDQIAKQPQLCVEIVRDGGVIIHVIARQVGEAGGADAHAVEPELIEPMRRGFQREMRHALAGQPIEFAMQRDRIRGGQRTIDGARGRHHADGADARGGMTEPLPDLAREGGDRSLAAGAGDGGDGRRLAWIESCRRERQRAARIRCRDKRDANMRGHLLSGHRNRTGSDRTLDEPCAVGLRTGEREKKIARLHGAAVHGEARDRDLAGPRIHSGVVAEKLAKFHGLPVPAQSFGSNIRMPFERTFLRTPESKNHRKCRISGIPLNPGFAAAHAAKEGKLRIRAPERPTCVYCVAFDAARIRRSDGGRSNLGWIPRSGAMRAITLPPVGTAFQPEVMKPKVSLSGCGSSSIIRS